MNKDLRFAFSGGMMIVAGLLMLFSTGCDPMPNGGVPIYVRIDSPTVVMDYPRLGSVSARIPDVWAESGSHNLGAYEMPISIPVLASGNVPMLISGGIYDNGTLGTRVSYPFYRPDTFTIPNAVAGHVYHHKPVYHYFPNTQNAFAGGDFEHSNPFDSKMSHFQYTNVTSEGSWVGGIIMGPADSTITSIQTAPMTVTTGGTAAYIEINYKNPNIYFDLYLREKLYDNTGSLISQQDFSKLTFKPSANWNKTYLNFSNEAGAYQGADFQVFFVTYRLPTINTPTPTTDTLLVDNIKFLYFGQ